MPDTAFRRPVLPLVGFRGAPGTRTRRTRADDRFPPDPWAFRRLSGGRPPDLQRGRSRPEAPLALSRPFRDMPLQPRTAASLHRPEGRATRPAVLPLLGFLALRHSLGPADPLEWRRIPPPPRAASGVWLPPSRPSPPGLPAPKRRSVPGLHPTWRSPRSWWVPPLGDPCPPDVAWRLHLPKELQAVQAAFRASFPRRVRSVVGRPKPSDRRGHPGFLPFRAFPPSARGHACSRKPGPLALRRGDVPIRLDHRASRIGWVGLARFRAAGSLGVSHLSTVRALRSSRREAGSWFRLTRDLA